MNEMNEKDLQQVSGGAMANAEIREWVKQHCTLCEMRMDCSYNMMLLYANRAVLEAKKGGEDNCPKKL